MLMLHIGYISYASCNDQNWTGKFGSGGYYQSSYIILSGELWWNTYWYGWSSSYRFSYQVSNHYQIRFVFDTLIQLFNLTLRTAIYSLAKLKKRR